MSQRKVSEKMRSEVEKRADFRCEYCQTTMESSTQRFEIEHIIAVVLGGLTILANLALACRGCNGHKHSKIEGFDKITNTTVPLFHPRKDKWTIHFAWDKDPLYMIGLTPTGRATISTLKLNRSQLISVRRLLQKLHMHPPAPKN